METIVFRILCCRAVDTQTPGQTLGRQQVGTCGRAPREGL